MKIAVQIIINHRALHNWMVVNKMLKFYEPELI